MTLPHIKVHLTEIDTCGVLRYRIQGFEYISVERICAAFGVNKKVLFSKLRVADEKAKGNSD